MQLPPCSPIYPEFAHLRVINFSAAEDYLIEDVKTESPRYSDSITQVPNSWLGSRSWTTVFGSHTTTPLRSIYTQNNISPAPQGSPPISKPLATSKPFLSNSENLIKNCSKEGEDKEDYQKPHRRTPIPHFLLSISKSPFSASKRPISKGRDVGALLNQRSQHFEIAEWIRMLKEKADKTVDSIQNPPPYSKQVRFLGLFFWFPLIC